MFNDQMVQIHKIRNLPKIKNMFMSKVHGNLGLGSFDDTIEDVMNFYSQN